MVIYLNLVARATVILILGISADLVCPVTINAWPFSLSGMSLSVQVYIDIHILDIYFSTGTENIS